MRSAGSRRMRPISGRASFLAATAVGLLLAPAPLSADWIPSALDQRCDQADIDGISRSIRDAIEASVRRAEATIEAPAAIGDLSCLDDLMNAPLDIFSNIGGLLGTLQGGLFENLPFSLDMDVSGMVCDFAAEKWGELTGGLGNLDVGLDQFASTPGSMEDRLAGGGGFGSGSPETPSTGSINTGVNGTTSLGGTNTSTGTGLIDVPVSDDVLGNPIYPDQSPDPVPEMIFDQAGYNAAVASHEAATTSATISYMACEIARQMGIVSYDQWGNATYTGPTYCSPPNLPPPPSVDDYFIAAALGGASMTPLGSTGMGASSAGQSSWRAAPPSELVGNPEGGAATPGATVDTRDGAVQSIWENL